MDYIKKLDDVRKQLDDLDDQMVTCFEKRMELSNQIASIKREGNIGLVDEAREQAVVNRVVEAGNPKYKGEISVFMRSLIALSRLRQRKALFEEKEINLLPLPRIPLKKDIKVAFQGPWGAWGEQASLQLFVEGERFSFNSFEDVFAAVKEKKVCYGVVPIENSQTGAIGEVYDLLRRYGCYIVGQTW
ncbi:MAG: prephenate dehydratase domain-containing protein, partial [Eubacteriales bacterium]|nr:prephenate dehydratase domain-containing protein [Eubacteriales bacterium]